MTNFLTVNCNLTSASREFREFRLPRMNPFPKLDRSAVVAQVSAGTGTVARSHSGATVIAGSAAPMPEMATDVIDPSVGYSVENVKRLNGMRGGSHSAAGLGQWVGRILGSHRTAHP